jgi:hypothetical protein
MAKAGDAMMSAKMIPGVLAVVLMYLGQSPTTQLALRSLPVQIVLGVTIVVMAGGYLLMRSMVQEAA